MRRFIAVIAAIWVSFAGVASADRLVVVELFTSQGCYSCPPADALLGELAKRDDVLPLAVHVDYWDYLGWKDAFADPQHTRRQRKYAAEGRRRSIFTPEMVVQGQSSTVGSRRGQVEALIATHKAATPVADIQAKREGELVLITVTPLSPEAPAASIYLISYAPSKTVEIARGENAGKTLTYHNIVTEMDEVGYWEGKAAQTIQVPAHGAGEMAVFLQAKRIGPILAAAKLN